MTILGQVLNKVLSNVDIVKTKMLPSTTENVNSKIIELFNMTKSPKLSERKNR